MTKVSKKELESISTPSSVKTFWGTLEFSDCIAHSSPGPKRPGVRVRSSLPRRK